MMVFPEKIRFNTPPEGTNALAYIQEAIQSKHICGDGGFTHKCTEWIEKQTGTAKALLTTSCTHGLEMAALLCDIKEGDEVIMSAYNFVSAADAFVLRGAKIVFVDIRPETMNIDERLIEAAITDRTRVISPMHYAGVGCEMDTIMEIAAAHHLFVVEDAAQGIMSTYKGKALGTIGDFGTLSFHETKNFSMGEGGALLLRDAGYIDDAEILREKGTDRSRYFRGQLDKYTWQDKGSSYLPSDINAALMYAQFEEAAVIQALRMSRWNEYYAALAALARAGLIELPFIPPACVHNAHMFYIKTKDLDERSRLIAYLKAKGILAVFHYIPLHTAPAGKRYGRFHGQDLHTTLESERLLRLPLFQQLTAGQAAYVTDQIKAFYNYK